MADSDLVTLTADIVAAFVSNNHVGVDDVANTIANVHAALVGLDGSNESVEEVTPAVSIRASVKPDQLTCLECAKTFKTLKRHLRDAHDLTPKEYRSRFSLRDDYPMTAPNYSEVRRASAVARGLGSKGRGKAT